MSAQRADRPTILYVDHATAMGGAEHSLVELLAKLDRDRFRPVLATRDGRLAEVAGAGGTAVRTTAMDRLQREPAAPWRLLTGARGLAGLIRRERAAIVHANTLRAAVYAALAAQLMGRPFVWHVRDILGDGASVRWLCRRASAVIAISHAVAGAMPCAREAEVIYNPVAPRPARTLSRSDLGLPTDGHLVASVGRLRPWKGHEPFLAAAARTNHPDARFLVIGGQIFGGSDPDRIPDYGARLRTMADELGIGDRVTFTGQREDLADVWPHLTILVHAAEAEPFGRVVAESLCAGVPVAAFRDGGVPEIVDHGTSGLLVEAGDVAALAAAIDELLADPDRRASMGRAGREACRARFAPAGHAGAVEAVYERLLPSRDDRAEPSASRTRGGP